MNHKTISYMYPFQETLHSLSYDRFALVFVVAATMAADRRTKPRGSLGANLPQASGGDAGRVRSRRCSDGQWWPARGRCESCAT